VKHVEPQQQSILSHTAASLREAFAAHGIDGYRANQVLQWVHRRGCREFAEMLDLPSALRADLREHWAARSLDCVSVHESTDGTRKLVLQTRDGARIEAVIIPDGERRTLCVSSQVGCSLDCSFCATALLGFGRNLRSDEIVDQFVHAADVLRASSETLSHVVFMGMGEPLLNLKEVVRAIDVITDDACIGLSSRRITVSTAGVVPRMAELGRLTRARLAVSLHATTNAVRDQLVPLNRRFPLEQLLEACRDYPLARRDRLSFEYTLIRDVNDSADDARRLIKLLHGMQAKINVIPMNEHAGSEHRRPDDASIEHFMSVLMGARIAVSLRRSRGDDIFAACGQLGALSPTTDATVSAARVR
jgi:23S rRNA (adenine2503-C2)-methyltransferase